MPKYEVLTHIQLPVYALVDAESPQQAVELVAKGEGKQAEIDWNISPKFYRSIGDNSPVLVSDAKTKRRWVVYQTPPIAGNPIYALMEDK